MTITAALLLAAALLCLAAYLRGNTTFLPARWRRGRYARLVARQIALFLLPTILALALLGRLDALHTLPAEFGGVRALVLGWTGPVNVRDMLGHAAVGLLLGGSLAAWRARRGGRPWRVGDVSSVLPRNRAELAGAAAASLVAGVAEELFFRLLLPLLVALATGNALAGFALGALLFGLSHWYQGAAGVAATLAVGLLLTLAYMLAGSVIVVAAVHAAIDLNAMVLRPLLERGRRFSS